MPQLRRTSPDQPGWTRRRAGRGFVYLDQSGARLEPLEVARIRDLAIPPAWEDVWICSSSRGHLQAVGTDEAGRRQYLYHPEWRIAQDAEKFERVRILGQALPKARERILEHLALTGMPQERATAAAVRMIDLGAFRIGNDVYADEHGSYGLTTLLRRHVRRHGDALRFTFTGKSGVDHLIEIDDAAVVAALDAMRRRRGGNELLAYLDRRRWHAVTPTLVNGYVRDVTGVEATAKDFRTWHGTVLAAAALGASVGASGDVPEKESARRRSIAAAMREVSQFLGNTPALARSSYVDPRVVTAYEEGRTIASAVRRIQRAGASPDERQAVLERATLRLLSQAV